MASQTLQSEKCAVSNTHSWHQRACCKSKLTIGIDSTQQVLMQLHLVEGVIGLLPLCVKLVVVL